jgi:hypothetical protein
MNKRPDFVRDIDGLKLDVNENVLKILSAAKERAPDARPTKNISQTTGVETLRDGASGPPPKPRTNILRKPSSRLQPSDAPVWKDVAPKLTVETKECLRRAAALQRAEGLKPDTEYAITNEALEDWFKRHGYRRRWKSRENREDGPETTAEPTTDEP